MDNKINAKNYNVDFSLIAQAHLDKKVNAKLSVIEGVNGKLIKWLSPQEIKDELKKGNKVFTDIHTVFQSVKDIDITKLNQVESKNLYLNLQMMVKKWNLKEKTNSPLSIFNKIFSNQEKQKEIKQIDNQLKELTDKLVEHVSTISKVVQSYDQQSFFDQHKDVTEENWPDLYLLIQSDDDKTFSKLQNNTESRRKVINFLNLTPAELEKKPELTHLLRALKTLDQFKSEVQQQDSLLKTLIFIEKNRHLMTSGEIGVASKSRKGLGKIKVRDLKYSIYYDSKGDVAFVQHFINEGAQKQVKKRIDFRGEEAKLEIEAKQRISEPGMRALTNREVQIQKKCSENEHVVHLSSVSYYNSQKKGETQVLTMPFCSLGSLRENLSKLSYEQKLFVLQDIIQGVIKLHQAGIIHRDIKPENIVLTMEQDKNGEKIVRAKIIDFGTAYTEEDDISRLDPGGTSIYMPPESHEGKIGTKAHDIWSIGMLCTDLINEKFSMPLYKLYIVPDNFVRLNDREKPSNEKSIEYAVWKMLRYQSSERMPLEEVLKIVQEEINQIS